MKRWSFVLVFVVAALLTLSFALSACEDTKDDEKSDAPEGEEPEPIYDLSIYGWAFGDGLYTYQAGRWNKDAASPFSTRIYGSLFADEEFGYVYGMQRIYRYVNDTWVGVADAATLPPGAVQDAAFTPDGTAWFAVNDPYDVGYLVRIAPEGAPANIPTEGVITSMPVKVPAVFSVPEDPALHMLAVVPEGNTLFYQHLTWDGTNRTSEIVLQIRFKEFGPPLPTDDDAVDDDDDTTGDDDTNVDILQMVELHDMAVAPDGTIWAAGWVRADNGTPYGALWYRVPGEEVTWERILLQTNSGCRTFSAEKIIFTPDDRFYVLADCGYSQVYRRNDEGEFVEMQLPGIKGSTYRISDLSLLSDTRGWAAGYSSDLGGPLLLLRNAEGWQQARVQTFDADDELFAAKVFGIPTPGGIGQPGVDDDDTTGDDDSVDDDDATATDDDTTAG